MNKNEASTYADTMIHQGGLMRCCIATIVDYVDQHKDEQTKEGLVLDCQHERVGNERIILTEDVFCWNQIQED